MFKNNKNLLVLLLVSIALTIFLLLRVINEPVFGTLFGASIILYVVVSIDPETITEIATSKFTIKRDLAEAKRIKKEISELAYKIAESMFLVAHDSFMAMVPDSSSARRNAAIVEELVKLSNPEIDVDEWWRKMTKTYYPDRVKSEE